MDNKPHHNTTHGMTLSSEFNSWHSMKERCLNSKSTSYKRYGGRGITICDRWINSFENFYADMGPKPSEKYSIERMNNDGNYEPSNCKWATDAEQAFNKSTTIMVKCPDGEWLLTKDAAKKYGLNNHTLYSRMRSGIPLDQKVLDYPAFNDRQYYSFNGADKTVQEICDETGISDFNLRYHLRQGKTVQDAIDINNTYNRKYLYQGKEYTITELASLIGVTHSTLNVRLKSGQTLEEAIKGIEDTKNIAKYNYKGKMLTINELIKETGYQSKALRRHLGRGHTVEEAISIIDKNIAIRKR
jgi:DNA-binding transcriptional ArsR family regulator